MEQTVGGVTDGLGTVVDGATGGDPVGGLVDGTGQVVGGVTDGVGGLLGR